eukprot:CAMPEP_0115259620 /NCGR_PEP_ID=MMETSP0270-20121206/47917_1 /TAXON_ID=71861 /ORGANISM="Scrippsiella trochoidea, Strain CCMP3099" /LENGTH=325 /DNA_ID=CAMNT_0002675433 /DNA_START=119 /DNA_END=1094 /DNA_ORIENTATION=+
MSFKLFLGGVAPTTQKEDIEAHFSRYGTIVDAVVMYKDGRHRGFGFVTFAEEEAMNAVLIEPQVIHDRTIDVKQALPGEQAPPPRTMNGGMVGGYGGGIIGAFGGSGGFLGAAPSGPPPQRSFGCGGGGKGGVKGAYTGATDKVFLGGLSPTTTDEMLSNHFGRYGNLVDVVVMKDKLSQKSRGFGFVRYDSTEPVEQVMADYESHEIDGKWIEVKKAVPQEQMGVTGAASQSEVQWARAAMEALEEVEKAIVAAATAPWLHMVERGKAPSVVEWQRMVAAIRMPEKVAVTVSIRKVAPTSEAVRGASGSDRIEDLAGAALVEAR